MSILSAQSLFHYTKKEYLISILKEGFAPRYSKEFVREMGEGITLGGFLNIPMVCFCDTPLSLVEKHMSIYGTYGIGLSKDWAIRNRLNPVFYINQNSTIHASLITSIHEFVLSSMGNHSMSNSVEDLVSVLRYLKPFKAILYKRDGKEYPDYSYYDEKEWRYVPHNLRYDQMLLSSDADDLEKAEAHEKLKSRSLTFTARDINFIIINNENDVDDILKALEESTFFTSHDIQYILTTFITSERIKENF